MKRFLISTTKQFLSRGFASEKPKTVPNEDEFFSQYDQVFKKSKESFENSLKTKKPKKEKPIKDETLILRNISIEEEEEKYSPKIPSKRQMDPQKEEKMISKRISKSKSPQERRKILKLIEKTEFNPLDDLEKTKFSSKEDIKEEKRFKFQMKHVESILEEYYSKERPLPIDKFVGLYLHKHREINAPRHRHFITNTVYGMIRWKLLIDYFYKKESHRGKDLWKEKIEIYLKLQDLPIQNIPPSLQVSCPSFLYEILENDYGNEKATEICMISNQEAPIFGRVNTLKITRESLINKLKPKKINVTEGSTPNGLKFSQRYNFAAMEEYENGYFEVQDESSQISASLLNPKPRDLVMDYCCGSGGKSLAFGTQMNNKGQIYLVDIREETLKSAKKRFNRAGIQNINPLIIGHPHLEKLKEKMNWIFVDVPCSGTGTMRRNPDLKYRLDKERMKFYIDTQRSVFNDALNYLKPKGRIIYSTCSILKDENEKQIEYFKKKYKLKVEEISQSLPEEGGKDGYFAVILSKINDQ